MTVFVAYGGRLAIEATMEPPITVSRNQGAKITGRMAVLYRAGGQSREGYPIVR